MKAACDMHTILCVLTISWDEHNYLIRLLLLTFFKRHGKVSLHQLELTFIASAMRVILRVTVRARERQAKVTVRECRCG